MNLVMLPMWLFSGVFFISEPISRIPPALHPGPAPHAAGQRPAQVILEGAGLYAVSFPCSSWPPGRSSRSPWPCGSSAGLESDSNRGCLRSSPRSHHHPVQPARGPAAGARRLDRSSGRGTSPWPGSRCRGTTTAIEAGSPRAFPVDEAGTANGHRRAERRRQTRWIKKPSQPVPLPRPLAGAGPGRGRLVDRLQKRLQMVFGPRLMRSRDQHDWQARTVETAHQGAGETGTLHRNRRSVLRPAGRCSVR